MNVTSLARACALAGARFGILFALYCALTTVVRADACDAPALTAELERRAAADQQARAAYVASKAAKREENAVLEIDAQNRVWLAQILEACGWPLRSVFGEAAARSAWLIAQHADMDSAFQLRAAEKMKLAVLKGEAEGIKLALLVDRNRRLQGAPQVYGMQFKRDQDGSLVFLPIVEPTQLDARRREIGLPPFRCWVETVEREQRTTAVWPAEVPKSDTVCPPTLP